MQSPNDPEWGDPNTPWRSVVGVIIIIIVLTIWRILP
jgi:hypothetical protein